jgi:pimeloyl-ACP methyl ester carboxylesterase
LISYTNGYGGGFHGAITTNRLALAGIVGHHPRRVARSRAEVDNAGMRPFEEATSVRLHRERCGSGAPVLLSHGLGDDSTTWVELVPLLAGDQTVITWDLRGHGGSERPAGAESYTAELAIADLLALVEDAGEPVHLVGHSLGGYLALVVSLRRPELVRSLTMVASGPGYRDPDARAVWNRHVDTAVVRMPVQPEAAGLARQADSWVVDNAGRLEPPLLLLVGERDTRFHAGTAFLGRAVAGSTVHHLAGAGHHPHRTHAEEVAALLLEHFSRSAPRVSG